MMLPSRLAFAAMADDDDWSWLPQVVESIVSLEEEKMPVDELLPPGATGMGTEALWVQCLPSWCCTEVVTLVVAEYWLQVLMLPSLAKLSPSSSSSELLREARWRISTPEELCSSREGREVPMAPSEASLVRASELDPLPARPESWSDS